MVRTPQKHPTPFRPPTNATSTQGKRKKSSRKPQGPKKREPLATTFTCLFCNHEKAIIVKLDKKLGNGQLHCKVCGQHFQTGINYLSAAVDVYSDWIDACEAVAKENADDADGDEANAEDRRFSTYGMSSGREATATAAVGGDDEDDEEY